MSAKSCVVLVPALHPIHPRCEAGLRKLEQRGYEVRRAHGFSSIELARCRMTAQALADGFDETMWIGTHLVFEPDDVERLRGYELDLSCGVYPAPGEQRLACQTLPGTREVLFGEAGGLIEVLYAGAGFLHVRRHVYETIRERLELPVCNQRFDRAFWPWFHPILLPDGDQQWYLPDDWSFCERARQSGYRVFADTSIRLSVLGGRGFTWEEAGVTAPKSGSFRIDLRDESKSPPSSPPPPQCEAVELLSRRHPWPAGRPSVTPRPYDGWLRPSARRELLLALEPRTTRVVLELGSWLGLSTRFIADHAPLATVITIDHWLGSPEHVSEDHKALLPILYETFVASAWDYRERVIPLRATTLAGMKTVSDLGIRPDVIYIDADHSYDAVRQDLETAIALFPTAKIVGDDWDWETVRNAVTDVCQRLGRTVAPFQTAWHISPNNSSSAEA